MSLATSIKDFSDTLNNLHTVKTSLPILPFLQEILLFSGKTILSGVIYLLTFEWFRDISYLPLLNPASPQQLGIANAEHLQFPDLDLSHLSNSASHLFSFLPVLKNSTNYLVSGISNSFFFSLPFSLPHLISIRRLFSQGIQAAFASLVGTVAAHSLFLISIFYGLRFLIIPWFSLEPTTYILGFLINVLIIKELIQASPYRFQQFSYTGTNTNTVANSNKIVGSRNTFAFFSSLFPKERSQMLRIGLLSFGLTWCEELNVFSSICHLTLNAQNSYLDLYPSTGVSNSLLVHTVYVIAFVLGNCGFSVLFYYLLFKSGAVVASFTNISSTRVTATINRLVMLLILTFTFASFPYYGLDYLLGKVSGFLPEDPVYKETVLSPTKITVNKKNTLFIKAESADKKKHSILLDINNFDNGVYLNNIDFNKFDNFPSESKGSPTRTTAFEKSNYRQENAWIRRNYLAKLRSRPRKNTDNSSTASFYKTFKDPKAYYQKIQLESDKKQSKSVRDLPANKRHGSSITRQEGVLAGELVYKTGTKTKFLYEFWDQLLGFPRDSFLKAIYRQSNYNKQTKASVETNKATNSKFSLPDYPFTNELDSETNIFGEKYTKGVKQKSSAPLLKKTRSLSTKKIIKRKFFLNPIYRTLVQTDIDTFMARQPAAYNIAENQDYDLYKKRLVLERYYNWLRYYSPLQSSLQDLYNIPETKSFVDSTFHHQFKGTLKIAKRLFPISFDPQQNNKKNRVLSYDQTLYKDRKRSENPFLHEELVPDLKQDFQNKNAFDQTARSPFIEESDTSPFYAGWDDTLRRFVVTNRFWVER